MPRYKAVPTLYSLCVKNSCRMVFIFCENLVKTNDQNKTSKIGILNYYLITNIPASILDDILMYFSTNNESSISMISYYFFKTILHRNVDNFRAKNLQLKSSYWECLFKTSLTSLTKLNLALSCTDEILYLISVYCPKLEYLKATCRYERMRMGSNATAFTCSITDEGLKHLCSLKNLKMITLNDPRSPRNGTKYSITYAGLRNLLINIPTLEDITYTDLGSVVSKDMEHFESLNLRVLRHFNATENSTKEILRLCKNLQDLYLAFFNIEDDHTNIIKLLLNSNLKFKSIGFVNFNFNESFDIFYKTVGKSLTYLSVSNSSRPISFNNLITIGKYCPNLTFLKYNAIDNSNESSYINKQNLIRTNYVNYFNKLEELYLSGSELDLENIFCLCIKNSEYLINLKITEYTVVKNVDEFILKNLNNFSLKHIEISAKLIFTEKYVRKIIDKFKFLSFLSVYCTNDGKELKSELIRENYDLTYINQKNTLF